MDTYRLAPLGVADAPVCVWLFVEVFAGPPWNYPWVTPEKAGRYIRDLLGAPGSLSFLYYENEKPVGFCVGSVSDYFFAPQYKIEECAVLTASQHRGVGSRMLAEVEALLKTRGVACVFLQTSRTIPAYGFYLKNGYAAVEDNVYFIKEI